MRMRFAYCLLIAMAALPVTPARAVDRPPFYKVFQFPPDKIPRIDGDPSDWDMVPDDYAIGMDQMTNDGNPTQRPDPKKLDVKVKVGWVKGLNRLYFLYEAYKDYWDCSQPDLHNDIFELVVDGDRSGGKFIARWRPDMSVPEFDAFFSMQGRTAQNYHIFTPAKDKDWCMAWGPQQWLKEFPYANHACQYNFQPGEGGKLVLEFYITPFDLAAPDGPEQSKESQLSENKIIGVSWAVMDYRGPTVTNHDFWNLASDAGVFAPPGTPGAAANGTTLAGHMMFGDASLLMPFKLMPLEAKYIKPFEAKWTFKVVDMSK
ncbi:MAG TPA: PKD domain containing protein, partial [Opitutales bacterium]|nr:PKD domain containing protein [Opitutales bacterium]